MTYAFGSVVHLTTEIRDSAGTLTNPAAITVTILQPDGTATVPAAGVNDSTGAYHYDFTPTQAGRHIARWVTTTPTGADEETFDVAAMWSEAGIVSLAEAKEQVNIPADVTTHDEELSGFVRATTAIVELHVGAIVRRSLTETFDGGREAITLTRAPVLTITSVTENGTAVSASGYSLSKPSGVLRRISGSFPICWRQGIGTVVVVYVPGRAVVEPNWTRGALIIIQHLWETQRNTSGRRPQIGETEVRANGAFYSIPNRAVELLGEPVSGIA